MDNANVSTIGPQYFNMASTKTFRTTDDQSPNTNTSTTTLEGPTEELDGEELTLSDAVNANSISSSNSSSELLHLIQQSTFFLNKAQVLYIFHKIP